MKTSKVNGAENFGSVDPVASAITRLILDGAYGPGDRLKLSELASRLGMGITPVREALWKLEGSGLVQNLPNRGAVVREIDETYITNVYEVRKALEAMLIEQSVPSATSSQLLRIEKARLGYEEAAKSGNPGVILAADAEFHNAINQIAGNDVAVTALKSSFLLISAMRQRIGFEQARVREVMLEHAAIADAIRAGDASLAAQCARRHANGARKSLLQAMRQEAQHNRTVTERAR